MKKTIVLMTAVLGLAACSGVPSKPCNPMKEECAIGDEPKAREPKTGPRLLEKDRVGGFYI